MFNQCTHFIYLFYVILDSLTEAELSDIAKELLPLTNSEMIEFAHVLEFNELEIDNVRKMTSDTHHQLLFLLCAFKKRTPATQYCTRRCLARALMEWGHNISLALRLYPKRKSMKICLHAVLSPEENIHKVCMILIVTAYS